MKLLKELLIKFNFLKMLLVLPMLYGPIYVLTKDLPEIIPEGNYIYDNFLFHEYTINIMIGIFVAALTTILIKYEEVKKELEQIKSTIPIQIMWVTRTMVKDEKKMKSFIKVLKKSEKDISKFKQILEPYLKLAIEHNEKYGETFYFESTLGGVENPNFENRKRYDKKFSERIVTWHFQKEYFDTSMVQNPLAFIREKELEKYKKFSFEHTENKSIQYLCSRDIFIAKVKKYLIEYFYIHVLQEIKLLKNVEKEERLLLFKILNRDII